MNYTAPKFNLEAFHCPLCGVYAHMEWHQLPFKCDNTMYCEAICSCCKKHSLWRATECNYSTLGTYVEKAELIYPDNGVTALPENDMPEDVKSDYIEAARIFSKSPRGAAALLRLGLQKLCKHLGQEGKNINDDIRALAASNVLPPLVIRVADTVRITGNNAVHPGEMDDEDRDYVASKMFELLNFIVKKGISEPKELKALYEMTPEKPRKAAETQDEKSKSNF